MSSCFLFAVPSHEDVAVLLEVEGSSSVLCLVCIDT